MPIAMETLNLDVIFVMFTERSFADTSDIKGPSEISTALEIGYGCTFMRDMTLKLPTLQYFKLLTEKPFDCYFQVRSPFFKTHITAFSRWHIISEKVNNG